MGSFSLMHWLVIVIYIGLIYLSFGIPVAKILNRMGLSRWWSVLVFVSIANIVGIWTLAYARWLRAMINARRLPLPNNTLEDLIYWPAGLACGAPFIA